MARRGAPLLLAVPILALTAVQASAGSVAPTGPLLGLSGKYALPATTPTQLVVFAHGHQNSAASWMGHLQDAANHGAVAVAPDYRGTGPAPVYLGWPAKAGAEDLATVARFFLNRCPTIKQVFLLGVSMGGNVSGLALANQPVRADGTPLFDYWVDVEGVNDLTQEYLLARGVAPVNEGGKVAQAEIEAETGGPLESKPAEYQSRTNIFRAPDIAASKVKGAVLVHSVEDGLVPYDQSPSMTVALRANGVPTDLYSVLRRDPQKRDPGNEQSTILGIAGLGESDPFAGHGWEGSNTHIVIDTGMQRLWALMDATTARPSNANFLVDSGLGTVPSTDAGHAPAPAGTPCSAATGARAISFASGTLGLGPDGIAGSGLPVTSTGGGALGEHGLWYLVAAAVGAAFALGPRQRRKRP
jgi:pimeloyl-ACP methyl ester carboxylesterase